jgi:hypothetical protein
VIVEFVAVVLGLSPKSRRPLEAKLLVTDTFDDDFSSNIGLLRENACLSVRKYVEKLEYEYDLKGRLQSLEAKNGLADSQNWDHSLCFMFVDMFSRSS